MLDGRKEKWPFFKSLGDLVDEKEKLKEQTIAPCCLGTPQDKFKERLN